MGNHPSGEVCDGRALGREMVALPPMVLAVEEVLWRGTSTIPEGMPSQMDVVPLIDGVQVPCGARFPPGPIWVHPTDASSVLTLQFTPRRELGEMADNELRSELLLPFDRLAALGAPLFTSLVLGLPSGGGSVITINQAIQSACDPAVPKVLLTLFRPQLPWGPGGSRPHPDLQALVGSVDDAGLGSCVGDKGGPGPAALQQQVGGVIQAMRVANETALHLQAAASEELENAENALAARKGESCVPSSISQVTSKRLSTASCMEQLTPRTALWCYQGTDGAPLGIRERPQVDGPRTGDMLIPGEVFGVMQELKTNDGMTYLLLADGRGWVFDCKPGVGQLCVRQPQCGDEKDMAWPPPSGMSSDPLTSRSSESSVFGSITNLIVSLTQRQEMGKLSEAESKAREALVLSQIILQSADPKAEGIVDPKMLESLRSVACEMAQELASVGGLKPKQLIKEVQKASQEKLRAEAEFANQSQAMEELNALLTEMQADLEAHTAELAECRAREQQKREECLVVQADLQTREQGWQSELAGLQAKASSDLQARELCWQQEFSQLVAKEQQANLELVAMMERDRAAQERLSEACGKESQLRDELASSHEREKQLHSQLEQLRDSQEQALRRLLEEQSATRQQEDVSRLAKDAEMTELRTELTTARSELNELRVREQLHKATAAQMEAVECQREALDAEVSRIQVELQAARDKFEQQEHEQAEQLEANEGKRLALQQEVAELKERLGKRDGEVVRLQKQLDAQFVERTEEASLTLQELDDLRSYVNQQDEKSLELLKSLEEERSAVRLAHSERDALRAELDTVRQESLEELATARESGAKAESELEAVRAQADAERLDLQSQLGAALQERDGSRDRMEELRAELEACAASQREELLAQASASREESEGALRTDLQAAQAQLEAAKAEAQALQEALTASGEEVERRSKQEEELNQKLSDAQAEQEDLKARMEDANSTAEGMYTELLELRDRVAQHQQMELELKSYRKREKEYQDLQQEVLRKCTQLNDLRTRLREPQPEADELASNKTPTGTLASMSKLDLSGILSARAQKIALTTTVTSLPGAIETVTTETRANVQDYDVDISGVME